MTGYGSQLRSRAIHILHNIGWSKADLQTLFHVSEYIIEKEIEASEACLEADQINAVRELAAYEMVEYRRLSKSKAGRK